MFADRAEAGRRLAEALAYLKDRPDVVVKAIPRGGVVVGAEVAERLSAELDVVIPRKLGAPGNPELAIGAVAGDGTIVLNEDAVRALGVDEAYIKREAASQREEIERRTARFLGGRGARPVEGKTVVVVDDGLATGSTALAAARALRAEKPARLILAVPVAPADTVERFKGEVDEIVVLEKPSFFYAVGQFYEDFAQTSDEEVIEFLRKSREEAGQEK